LNTLINLTGVTYPGTQGLKIKSNSFASEISWFPMWVAIHVHGRNARNFSV
jgi:hypothetical protein